MPIGLSLMTLALPRARKAISDVPAATTAKAFDASTATTDLSQSCWANTPHQPLTEAPPVRGFLPVCHRRLLQTFSIQLLHFQGRMGWEGVKDTVQQQSVVNTVLGMHKASSPLKVYADLDNSSHKPTLQLLKYVPPSENMIKECH